MGRKDKGDFYAFGGQEFIALAAPTRTGKGVGFIIPNLLNYELIGCTIRFQIYQFKFEKRFSLIVLNRFTYKTGFNPKITYLCT
nr:type IV secretory system conjugative DNA transfer family protein [Helicobacter suis]